MKELHEKLKGLIDEGKGDHVVMLEGCDCINDWVGSFRAWEDKILLSIADGGFIDED